MQLFKNILLRTGYDYNIQVLKQISAFVDKNGADLKVMYAANGAFEQKYDQIRAHNHLRMDSLLRSLNSQDLNIHNILNELKLRVQFKTMQGEALQAVSKEIDCDRHDLIVVDGSHKNVMVSQLLTHAAIHG